MPRRDPEAAIYRQIAAELRAHIEDGSLQPGQPLGTVAQLAHRYDIGEPAIRKAVGVLRFEGLVVGQPGQVPRVRDLPEVETVKVPRGAEMTFRLPTPEEQDNLSIAPGVIVAVVSYGGRTQVYPTIRTRFTFA